MGELHLEIYVERMKREYNVACSTGKPRVAFRETITERASFSFTHKKQTGGAGQFARIMGYMEPIPEGAEFVDRVVGGVIPEQYIPGVERVSMFVLLT